MSGHSKWATTHKKKEVADAKKSGVFTKLARNISVAARNGSDPDMNFSLRLAIDRAKAVSMPKENIERAVKRGAGELDGVTLEEIIYEGFAPHGVALLIEVVTDNRNRTMGDLREILSKAGGALGSQNSVKWMFEHKGVIHLAADQIKDKDALILDLIELGADDVAEEDGLTLFCSYENFEKIKKQLEGKGSKIEYAAVEWVAKEKMVVDDEVKAKVEALIEQVEEHDDVSSVYSNMGECI
ncbi:MAG: YebC/PmpR family DNA-binding transcriptional regulator, partial [Patescibacteria group bacterium]